MRHKPARPCCTAIFGLLLFGPARIRRGRTLVDLPDGGWLRRSVSLVDRQAGSGRRNEDPVESAVSSHGRIRPAHRFATRLPQERVSARHGISGAPLLFLCPAVLPRRANPASGLPGAHARAGLFAVWSRPGQLCVDPGHLLQRQVVLDSAAPHGRLDLRSRM